MNSNLIVITFAGDYYVNCTEEQARNIQRRSGGSIRSLSEPLADLIKAFADTYGTYHNKKQVKEAVKTFEEDMKKILA